MKILHTSDWHLGHILYNQAQDESQQAMLEQIEAIVSQERPDVFLLSGDVYDTTQPSASVQQMLANALVRIHRAHPRMHIISIAGNHDSGSRHMIFHAPWRELGVTMIGSINHDSDLDDYIIELPGVGFIVAVPFAADRFMPDDVFRQLSSRVAERNVQQLPVVLTAHLAIDHCDSRGHETFTADNNIGGLNCQPLEVFGTGYDYVALGHIHRQQALTDEGRVWYSGTPLAVSFDEVYSGNEHGVLLAECNGHGAEVTVKSVPIENTRPLVNIPAEGTADWETVRQRLKDFPADIPAYLRLNVEVEDYLPAGANDEALSLIRGKACILCNINSCRKARTQQDVAQRDYTASELQELSIVDVARMWIESKGEDFDDTMQSMLNEVICQLDQQKQSPSDNHEN